MSATVEHRPEEKAGELLKLASVLSRLGNEALEAAVRLNFPATDIATLRLTMTVLEQIGDDIESLLKPRKRPKHRKMAEAMLRKAGPITNVSQAGEATAQFFKAVRLFQGALQAAKIVRKPMATRLSESLRDALKALRKLAAEWHRVTKAHENSLSKKDQVRMQLEIQQRFSTSSRCVLIEEIDHRRSEVSGG